MSIKIKFFARFRDVFGSEIIVDIIDGTYLLDLIKGVASMKKDGYTTLFNNSGSFHRFVILMRNGKRIEHSDAGQTLIAEGDEIAVFPPVAGG